MLATRYTVSSHGVSVREKAAKYVSEDDVAEGVLFIRII